MPWVNPNPDYYESLNFILLHLPELEKYKFQAMCNLCHVMLTNRSKKRLTSHRKICHVHNDIKTKNKPSQIIVQQEISENYNDAKAEISSLLQSGPQMDTTEAAGTTTIYDLPTEVIGIMLQHVTSYEDRKNSRSVCELWCDFVNRDSSSEKYFISRKNINNDYGYRFSKFKFLVPEFLSFQRKKISLEFESVDLSGTNNYWIKKGNHIIGLEFKRCIYVPIKEICKYCDNIREIKITDFERQILWPMKETANKGITNSSVHLLNIKLNYPDIQTIDFILQINNIFTCLKELHLIGLNLYRFDDLDTISGAFANCKFKIILKTRNIREGDLEVAFNSLPDRPISLLHLFIRANYQNEEQLLNSICKYYYRDLCSLTVVFQTDISFLKFQEFISNSSLKLRITAARVFHVCEFFKNYPEEFVLRYLEPGSITSILIEKNMVDSYQNIRSLQVSSISLFAFAEIMNGLTTLDFFHCEYVTPDVVDLFHNEIVTNEGLRSLVVPISLFLQSTIAEWIYDFPNLEILVFKNHLANNTPLELGSQKLNRNIGYHDLKYMNCPQLTKLYIDLVKPFDLNNPRVHIESIKNILYPFPNIESLMFIWEGIRYSDKLRISDEELSDLLRCYPKLKDVSCFVWCEGHIERLRSRM